MSETQLPPGIRDRIEAGFERWGHFVFRRAWTTLAGAAFVTLALASQLPKLELETSTEDSCAPTIPSGWHTTPFATSSARTGSW